MSSQLKIVSREQLLQTALCASVIWLLLWTFASEIHYIADDSTVLRPLFGGGFIASLRNYVRPLEYLFAATSREFGMPVWLAASFLAHAGSAILTLALANILTANRTAAWWKALTCAASPIAGLPYFQIDTVSQSLADALGLAFSLGVILTLRESDSAVVRRWSFLCLVPVAFLTVLSKETSYGIVFLGCVLLVLRHGRPALIPALAVIAALLTAVVWSLFNTFDVTPGTHYGFHTNPLYWVFALFFSAIVNVLPVPTSLLLTGSYARNAVTLTICGIGVLAALCFATLLLRPAVLRTVRGWFTWPANPFDKHAVVCLFLLFSIVPSVFFKASELYASQMLPYMKALLIAATAGLGRGLLQRYWIPLSMAWVATSAINLIFYSMSTGYDPAAGALPRGPRLSFYLAIQDAVLHQERKYSVYSVNTLVHNQKEGSCELDPWDPTICLPPNIATGFPYLRRRNEFGELVNR